MILSATYTGNLVAFMTVIKVPVPFNTLTEMVNQDQYKFGTLGSSVLETLLQVGVHHYHTGFTLKLKKT